MRPILRSGIAALAVMAALSSPSRADGSADRAASHEGLVACFIPADEIQANRTEGDSSIMFRTRSPLDGCAADTDTRVVTNAPRFLARVTLLKADGSVEQSIETLVTAWQHNLAMQRSNTRGYLRDVTTSAPCGDPNICTRTLLHVGAITSGYQVVVRPDLGDDGTIQVQVVAREQRLTGPDAGFRRVEKPGTLAPDRDVPSRLIPVVVQKPETESWSSNTRHAMRAGETHRFPLDNGRQVEIRLDAIGSSRI